MKEKMVQLKKLFISTGYQKKIIFIFFLIAFSYIFELASSFYFTNNIVNIQIPAGNIQKIILLAVCYIVTMMITCYLVLSHCVLRFKVIRQLNCKIRNEIFMKLQKVNAKFYDTHSTGEILQLISQDAENAANLFPKIFVEMYGIGMLEFLILCTFFLFINITITILIITIYLIGYFITIVLNKKTIRYLKTLRKINIEIYDQINQALKGFIEIKCLGIEEEKLQEFEEVLEKYNKSQLKLEKVMRTYNFFFSIISSFSIVIITILGGESLINGTLSYGAFMLFINSLGEFKGCFRWAIRRITEFNQSYIAFVKIIKFLQEEMEDDTKGKCLEEIESMEFKNVSYFYQEKEIVIDHFNLSVDSKEKIALVGKTGSGKSTIVKLICRLYEPKSGHILINGEDYTNYTIKSLRSKIGYVMQETSLVQNTIIDNIRYANPKITLKEIESIFQKLQLHEKIQSLKEGYHTDIYHQPDILSEGQRQMIHFARVMAMNSEIVILDEFTSSLSYEAEELLKNAVKIITKNRISFIIAHRLSTIQNADKIILLEKGKVIEAGKHEELLQQRGKYYKLVHS